MSNTNATPATAAKRTQKARRKLQDGSTVPANAVLTPDGQVVKIGETLDSVQNYVQNFLALKVEGETNFVTSDHGFSNPVTPFKMGVQGSLKTIAVALSNLAQIQAKGTPEEKTEAAAGIKGILAFEKVAIGQVIAAQEAAEKATLLTRLVQILGSKEQADQQLNELVKKSRANKAGSNQPVA